jgi:hypothetical protein
LSGIELIVEALVPSAYVLASVLDTSTATTVRLPIQNPHYLLANGSEIAQNELIMKSYSLLVATIIAVVICASSFAQDKASLQPNATILSVLQGSSGKTVELRMQCGEKVGGKVEQVNDNVVLLSHLTGAEYFDGFVNVKVISAVVIRSAGK